MSTRWYGIALLALVTSATTASAQTPGHHDRIEDRIDARHHGGVRDRIEDSYDRREDRIDRREDVLDRREDRRDRMEDRRDRRH